MKALIFDLDGTLIDSVYVHTLAWQSTLANFGMECPAWEIHRRIGMSGRLLVKSLARVRGRTLSNAVIEKLEEDHSERFHAMAPCQPLPGARKLLAFLHETNVAYAIATSGKRADFADSLTALALSSTAVVIDGDQVREVKPEPDLFLLAQQQLQVERSECLVVGDAIWDIHAARRAGILAVGLLSGGFGEQELYNAGAMRVFMDPQALYDGIDELGVQS